MTMRPRNDILDNRTRPHNEVAEIWRMFPAYDIFITYRTLPRKPGAKWVSKANRPIGDIKARIVKHQPERLVRDLLLTRALAYTKHVAMYNSSKISNGTDTPELYLLPHEMNQLRRLIWSMLLGQGVLATDIVVKRVGKSWTISFGYHSADEIVLNNQYIAVTSGVLADILRGNVRIDASRVHHVWLVPELMTATMGFMSLTMSMRDIAVGMLTLTKTYGGSVMAAINGESVMAGRTPGYHSGVFITVAGRTFRTKLTNRKLVAKYDKGRKSRAGNVLTDKSRTTMVNRYGTYSITAVTAFTM